MSLYRIHSQRVHSESSGLLRIVFRHILLAAEHLYPYTVGLETYLCNVKYN